MGSRRALSGGTRQVVGRMLSLRLEEAGRGMRRWRAERLSLVPRVPGCVTAGPLSSVSDRLAMSQY